MKKRLLGLLAILMIEALAFGMSACGGKKEEDKGEDSGKTETVTDEGPKVVDSIVDIDTEDMHDLPLQIESVTLFDDGSVAVVPTEDLKKNAEDNDEIKDGAMHPFADSGKVKKIYLVRFGNGGYRTVICLMDNGSLSALSARELIEDHIAVVMDNVAGRDNFVSVEQREEEDGFGVVGITDADEEVELDASLNF